jgi:hypothetical protein
LQVAKDAALRVLFDDRLAVSLTRLQRHIGVTEPHHGKLHPDGVALVGLVLDLGFGKCCAFDHRPHDRLGAAVELAGFSDLQQFAGDPRLGMEIHGLVGLVEITLDAQTLELLGLHRHPVLGIGAAFLAEFEHRCRFLEVGLFLALGAVVFLLDLPLDRQAVAVPAGHVVAVVPAHLERAGDNILEDFVERMADMDVAVGIGRAVMQHVFRAAGGTGAQLVVKPHSLPSGDQFRLLLRQSPAHRKIGFRQVKRLGIIECIVGVGHGVAIFWADGPW